MIIRPLAAAAALAAALFLLAGAPEVATEPVAASSSAPEEFIVDAGHSTVLFRVLHVNAGPFWGRFNKVSGKLALDAKNLSESYVNVTVDASSVDSNSQGRDRHLRGTDFLSAKEFPNITFESRKVEDAGGGDFALTGDLTFRGVTRTVSFTAEHTGSSSMGRFGPRVGYEAVFTFKRSDHGSKYGLENKAVGDEIRIVVALEGMKERRDR